MTQRCLIIAASPERDIAYVRRYAAEADCIICADGGYAKACALGIVPDLVIGDFDSGRMPEAGIEVQRLPKEKDDVDAQACVQEAVRRGYTDIVVVCASGGRADHYFCNVLLTEYAARLGARCMVADGNNRIMLHPGGTVRYPTDRAYRYVSLVPLDRTVTGVTLRGMKYPLQDAALQRDHIISISNEAQEAQFEITVGEGRVLVIFSKDVSV